MNEAPELGGDAGFSFTTRMMELLEAVEESVRRLKGIRESLVVSYRQIFGQGMRHANFAL